ncbi:MAG: hypothetical protein FWC41_13055 [Firmicutes bacterium]|nr:hypothetical protein [Bacillota bacterium]
MEIKINIEKKEDIMFLLKPLIEKYCVQSLYEEHIKGRFVDRFDFKWKLYSIRNKYNKLDWNWNKIYHENTNEDLVELFLGLYEGRKKPKII